jgi:transposase InsO family protein
VVILAKGRILVPEEKDLMHGIFQVIHDQHLHCGLGAAQERLVKAKLYIPNFTKHFEEYYKACTCQHARAPHGEQDTGPLLVTPRFYPLSHLYIDFCSLPFTDEVYNKSYVGAAIIVDAASRACEFTAVENKTALTAVACLQRWINHWGRPVMVHCDNGSHFTGGEFTDFLARLNIAQDPGTPYHSAARGLVERLVGKLKDGLRRLLPQGKLLQWPAVLNELELLLNQAPHRALGGISPYDYLLRGHRYRDERFVVTRDADHPLGRVTLNWAYSLPGSPSPQREEDLAFCLDSMRQIADWCAEISSFKASIESQGSKHPLNAQLGDTVLRFMALRENSLEPIYQGPYKITQDLGGDFYTVCELLAGDALGKPVQVHSSRIIKYDMSRSSADAEHQRKLPPDHYVVEAVLHGPDKDHEGHFLIKWLGVPEPKWERAHGLRQVLKFRQFCHDNNLTLEGKIPRRVKFAPELQPQPVQPPAQLRVMQHGLFYTFCPNALTQSSTF